jgi:L-asparaginase II
MRSSAKPFQAIPFLENGGQDVYQLTHKEIALICSSHSGTDDHVEVARSIQSKANVSESDLLCGTHYPMDEATTQRMKKNDQKPTPNQHNCSGKHSGMLAFARMRNLPIEDYVNPQHPIQQEILHTFAEFCKLPIQEVKVGADGCTAPNFAVPLINAALAFARLCDPKNGEVKPAARTAACQTIVQSMTTHPEMVGGPDRFDTDIMEHYKGRIVSKGGAEGYQAIGLMPGVFAPGSPAVGIAFKISDGDLNMRACPAVCLEVLHQLGVLDQSDRKALVKYGPELDIYNWRKLIVGKMRPSFQLKFES